MKKRGCSEQNFIMERNRETYFETSSGVKSKISYLLQYCVTVTTPSMVIFKENIINLKRLKD